jgi:putative ABC transport system substrate-binding protein
MIRRLRALALIDLTVCLALIGVSSTADAQQMASPRRIGILVAGASSVAVPSVIEELQHLGYDEGRNLTVELRNAGNKPAQLPDLARELVQLKPDVILTMGTREPTVAAMKATNTIPIVFVHAVDPVRAGLVASLARPGGNVTGITSLNADLGAKRLELITEIVPGIRRVVVLVSPSDPETGSMLRVVESAARARRVHLEVLELGDRTGLDRALNGAMKGDAGALLVLGSPPLYSLSPSLAELTAKHRVPTVSAWKEFPEAGGLASYGTSIPEMFQRAARLVDRILKGARPAELPVEQPTKFELVVNLKTAKAFKLKIPESILLRADEVIQ